MKLLKLILLYCTFAAIVLMNSSAVDEEPTVSSVHFEYQQF